jgi:MerR family transcriptional regulator, light-induced transcriptional regulator
MIVDAGPPMLDAEGLQRFQALQTSAAYAVTEYIFATHASTYEHFGSLGRDACREELADCLEFLQTLLAFGLLQPMVDYLRWLADRLRAQSIPPERLEHALAWLAEYFSEHMAARDGALVAAALRTARTSFLATGQAPLLPPMPPTAWAAAAAFEAALLVGQQRQASAIVNRLMDEGHGLIDIELHVIQPALYAIGEKWQATKVSVAQEHLVTAIAQSVMTEGLLRSPPPVPNHKRALLACIEGNHHAVGLRMVADALLLAGWDVQHLGANVPTLALVRHAAEWQPDLIGLSVSCVRQVQAVRAVIAQLDERHGSARPAVIIGGLAINWCNALAGVAGADAFTAEAQAAVVWANRLVSGGVIR